MCISIFTFELDVALHNAFVVMKNINFGDCINCLSEPKRRVAPTIIRILLKKCYNRIVRDVGTTGHIILHGGKKRHK